MCDIHASSRRRILMSTLGAPEIILILVIVLLLFGVGRIGKIGGELGKGIKSFREGLKGDEPEQKPVDAAPAENVAENVEESVKPEDNVPPSA
jgi:sec-independent protein translocase protein TatA